MVQRTAVSSEDEPSDASRRSTRPLIASGHSLRAATAPSASPLLGRPRYTRAPSTTLSRLAKVHLYFRSFQKCFLSDAESNLEL